MRKPPFEWQWSRDTRGRTLVEARDWKVDSNIVPGHRERNQRGATIRKSDRVYKALETGFDPS